MDFERTGKVKFHQKLV